MASSTARIVQSFSRWGRQEGYVASCDTVIAAVHVKFPHSALTTLFSHSEITIEILCKPQCVNMCSHAGSFSQGVVVVCDSAAA